MKLTARDVNRESQFYKATANHLGNLHERMKAVIDIYERIYPVLRPGDLSQHPLHDLGVAIYDLKTEVAFYEPAKPPYARRTTTHEQLSGYRNG